MKPDLKIADIGTGTGIFLLDLVRTLPSTCILHGYDISPTQFPYKEHLPKILSFHTLDITKTPPADFHGQYDIIHIRFFAFVVQNNDPGPIIENCKKLLKPGGYLQWVDVCTGSYTVDKSDPEAPSENMQALVEELHADHGDPTRTTVRSWVSNLGGFFTKHGLGEVHQKAYPPKESLQKYWTDMGLLVLEDYSYSRLDRAPDTKGTGKGKYLRGVINNAFQEGLRGVSMGGDMVAVVGRKPA